MLDPIHDREPVGEPAQQSARKEAHKLEAYLDAFRPVLTDTEIATLEDRINRLRQA